MIRLLGSVRQQRLPVEHYSDRRGDLGAPGLVREVGNEPAVRREPAVPFDELRTEEGGRYSRRGIERQQIESRRRVFLLKQDVTVPRPVGRGALRSVGQQRLVDIRSDRLQVQIAAGGSNAAEDDTVTVWRPDRVVVTTTT